MPSEPIASAARRPGLPMDEERRICGISSISASAKSSGSSVAYDTLGQIAIAEIRSRKWRVGKFVLRWQVYPATLAACKNFCGFKTMQILRALRPGCAGTVYCDTCSHVIWSDRTLDPFAQPMFQTTNPMGMTYEMRWSMINHYSRGEWCWWYLQC